MLEHNTFNADASAFLPVFVAEDAALHNYIANHPDVRPTMGYHDGETDLSGLVGSPNHRLLSDGIGVAALFEWNAPGVWQSHTMALPHLRGSHCLKAMQAFANHMFEVEGARMLWGATPDRHLRAIALNKRLGAKPEGAMLDVRGEPCTLYVLEKA